MKLLYCTECHDVRSLRVQNEVTCECGRSAGQQADGGLTAWTSGPCYAMEFEVGSFFASMKDRGSTAVKFRACWVGETDDSHTQRETVPVTDDG